MEAVRVSDERCLKCGAKCCVGVPLHFDDPEAVEDFDHVQFLLLHEGVRVGIEAGDGEKSWFAEFPARCGRLTPDGRCADYANRPRVCRIYDPETCEASERVEPILYLETPDDLYEWMSANGFGVQLYWLHRKGAGAWSRTAGRGRRKK